MRSNVEKKRVFALLPAIFALAWAMHNQMHADLEPIKNPTVQLDSTQQLGNRSPASVPRIAAAQADNTVHFDCRNQRLISKAMPSNYLRLVGKNCSKKSKLKVKHAGKEISAQVFWLGGKKLTTELIHLEKGMNDIQVSFNEKGNKTKERTIRVENTF